MMEDLKYIFASYVFYEKEVFFVKLNDNEILRAGISVNGNPFIKLDKRDNRSIEVI